jgi:hypothetical protein
LNVDYVTIKYTSEDYDYIEFEAASGKDKVRYNPVRYEGTLIPGQSKINVPTNCVYDEVSKTYTSTTYKTLTYYTFDFVARYPQYVEDATITDPMEVCMYYTAFGTYPANYANNTGSISYLFGNNSRQVSEYDRKDGYAKTVPWTGVGHYYELDIDIDGTYSSKNRGSGRVVAFDDGFGKSNFTNVHAYNYDHSPVCVYTDDHYNTWLEYYNNGTWSNRFSAEGVIGGTSYSEPLTVELTNFDINVSNTISNKSLAVLISDLNYYDSLKKEQLI